MEDYFSVLFSIITLAIGVYYFRNPKKMQQKEIDRLRWFKFLLKAKLTSWIYYSMLEDVSDKSFLKRAKLVSVGFIFMGSFVLLILFYKYMKIIF